MVVIPPCWRCDWSTREGFCRAFPDGIPADIAKGRRLHEEVLPGQEGEFVFATYGEYEYRTIPTQGDTYPLEPGGLFP